MLSPVTVGPQHASAIQEAPPLGRSRFDCDKLFAADARPRADIPDRLRDLPVPVWRCPMGASFETAPAANSVDRIFEAFFQNNSAGPRQFFPQHDAVDPIEAAWRTPEATDKLVPADWALRLIQDRADIDISGPEFNFVRSIRVFDVRYARQHESGREGDYNRSATVVLGTYGTQGDFAWQRSSITALPFAHIGLERWGQNCPGIYHRSVFVDWRDYEGNYGFEQVNY